MPRIRSIHPGFWTDEAVVSVSPVARLFFIGLWNQCDDQGVFEWKPAGLRMRIFPADLLDPVKLLHELEAADLIRAFEMARRRYGVVRNFVIFQRPKKPRNVHPFDERFSVFNGLASKSSLLGGNRWGNRSAEGGGTMEEVPPRSPPASGGAARTPFKNGFTESTAADLQEASLHAQSPDPPPDRPTVVPIPRHSHRH